MTGCAAPRHGGQDEPDAPGPTSAKGIQITVTDLDTGESSTKVIWNDYVLICAGSCYRHYVQVSLNGTHVITVKGCKP